MAFVKRAVSQWRRKISCGQRQSRAHVTVRAVKLMCSTPADYLDRAKNLRGCFEAVGHPILKPERSRRGAAWGAFIITGIILFLGIRCL